MIDYRYVAAFLAVARSGSISGAAQTLNLSQSALSRQIALFEQALGEDVFFRGTRGVELTPKGTELFVRLADVDRWAQADFVEQQLPIRIGALEGALNFWLGPRLASANPEELPAELFLIRMDNEQIQTALESRRIDLGLSSQKIESEWVSSRRLYSEKIVLISNAKLNLKALDQYTWIGVSKSAYLQRIAGKKKPKRTIQAGSLELLFQFVKAGAGVAAVPENLIPEGEFITTPTPLASEALYLNLPSYQRLPKSLEAFVGTFLTGPFPCG